MLGDRFLDGYGQRVVAAQTMEHFADEFYGAFRRRAAARERVGVFDTKSRVNIVERNSETAVSTAKIAVQIQETEV